MRQSRPLAIAVTLLAIACSSGDSGSGYADNGGIGGTGISQGSVTAFGSIFVNGVEWDLARARVKISGATANQADLRLGMQVRVVGTYSAGGTKGNASSVVHDATIEGPIEALPVVTLPGGSEKTFAILGRTIHVVQGTTIFDGGASFGNLARGQVLEVSGFERADQSVRATRVEFKGDFPSTTAVEYCGVVQNPVKNIDGSGIFDIDGVTIRYTAATVFDDLTRAALASGTMVDVRGNLRLSGSEIDADRIEPVVAGLGQQAAPEVDLTGFVSNFVSLSDFKVAGIPVDASAAVLSPPTLVVANDVLLELEGSLVAGRIRATRLELEDDASGSAKIEAAVSATNAAQRELTILGITVQADGKTTIQDERDGDPNFTFGEISVGDYLKIEGRESGAGRVVAKQIARDVVGNDVILRGSVTALDPIAPTLSVLGQSIPIDSMTSYSDSMGRPRSEQEFFRNPGDVRLGDVVEVHDESAVDPSRLLEADEVELY